MKTESVRALFFYPEKNKAAAIAAALQFLSEKNYFSSAKYLMVRTI